MEKRLRDLIIRSKDALVNIRDLRSRIKGDDFDVCKEIEKNLTEQLEELNLAQAVNAKRNKLNPSHINHLDALLKDACDDAEHNLSIYDGFAGRIATQHGAICSKCKQHYPYADFAENFECWSCKNGF